MGQRTSTLTVFRLIETWLHTLCYLDHAKTVFPRESVVANIRVCKIENEAEASLVCSLLDKRKIPYTLLKTHDAAFDGLYEIQMDWGYIEAPEEYAQRINQIVKDLKPRMARGSSSGRERSSGKASRYLKFRLPRRLY